MSGSLHPKQSLFITLLLCQCNAVLTKQISNSGIWQTAASSTYSHEREYVTRVAEDIFMAPRLNQVPVEETRTFRQHLW